MAKFFLLLCVLLTCSGSLFGGQTAADGEKSILPDNYELKYLGCSLSKDQMRKSHLGNFLLIWKSNTETQLLGILSSDGRSYVPTADFEIHHPDKWTYVGRTGLEAPGTKWFKIKPGQVIAFKVYMSLVEHDMPILASWVQGADKARLLLQTNSGRLESDDIILPLVPNAGK